MITPKFIVRPLAFTLAFCLAAEPSLSSAREACLRAVTHSGVQARFTLHESRPSPFEMQALAPAATQVREESFQPSVTSRLWRLFGSGAAENPDTFVQRVEKMLRRHQFWISRIIRAGSFYFNRGTIKEKRLPWFTAVLNTERDDRTRAAVSREMTPDVLARFADLEERSFSRLQLFFNSHDYQNRRAINGRFYFEGILEPAGIKDDRLPIEAAETEGIGDYISEIISSKYKFKKLDWLMRERSLRPYEVAAFVDRPGDIPRNPVAYSDFVPEELDMDAFKREVSAGRNDSAGMLAYYLEDLLGWRHGQMENADAVSQIPPDTLIAALNKVLRIPGFHRRFLLDRMPLLPNRIRLLAGAFPMETGPQPDETVTAEVNKGIIQAVCPQGTRPLRSQSVFRIAFRMGPDSVNNFRPDLVLPDDNRTFHYAQEVLKTVLRSEYRDDAPKEAAKSWLTALLAMVGGWAWSGAAADVFSQIGWQHGFTTAAVMAAVWTAFFAVQVILLAFHGTAGSVTDGTVHVDKNLHSFFREFVNRHEYAVHLWFPGRLLPGWMSDLLLAPWLDFFYALPAAALQGWRAAHLARKAAKQEPKQRTHPQPAPDQTEHGHAFPGQSRRDFVRTTSGLSAVIAGVVAGVIKPELIADGPGQVLGGAEVVQSLGVDMDMLTAAVKLIGLMNWWSRNPAEELTFNPDYAGFSVDRFMDTYSEIADTLGTLEEDHPLRTEFDKAKRALLERIDRNEAEGATFDYDLGDVRVLRRGMDHPEQYGLLKAVYNAAVRAPRIDFWGIPSLDPEKEFETAWANMATPEAYISALVKRYVEPKIMEPLARMAAGLSARDNVAADIETAVRHYGTDAHFFLSGHGEDEGYESQRTLYIYDPEDTLSRERINGVLHSFYYNLLTPPEEFAKGWEAHERQRGFLLSLQSRGDLYEQFRQMPVTAQRNLVKEVGSSFGTSLVDVFENIRREKPPASSEKGLVQKLAKTLALEARFGSVTTGFPIPEPDGFRPASLQDYRNYWEAHTAGKDLPRRMRAWRLTIPWSAPAWLIEDWLKRADWLEWPPDSAGVVHVDIPLSQALPAGLTDETTISKMLDQLGRADGRFTERIKDSDLGDPRNGYGLWDRAGKFALAICWGLDAATHNESKRLEIIEYALANLRQEIEFLEIFSGTLNPLEVLRSLELDPDSHVQHYRIPCPGGFITGIDPVAVKSLTTLITNGRISRCTGRTRQYIHVLEIAERELAVMLTRLQETAKPEDQAGILHSAA